jgi:lycopene cyclase domain-containing protein
MAFLRIKPKRPTKRILLTVGILIVMTAIFDSIIIALGIVDYNPDKILGLYVGNAPIEDFFYAILAVLIVPVIWNGLSITKSKSHAK